MLNVRCWNIGSKIEQRVWRIRCNHLGRIKKFSPVNISSDEIMTAKEYQAMKKRIAQLERKI